MLGSRLSCLLVSMTISAVEKGRSEIELIVYRHSSAMKLLLKPRRLKRRRTIGLQGSRLSCSLVSIPISVVERRRSGIELVYRNLSAMKLLLKRRRLKRRRTIGLQDLERRPLKNQRKLPSRHSRYLSLKNTSLPSMVSFHLCHMEPDLQRYCGLAVRDIYLESFYSRGRVKSSAYLLSHFIYTLLFCSSCVMPFVVKILL
jgi:hypothetical protein